MMNMSIDLEMKLDVISQDIAFEIEKGSGGILPPYEGGYEVTPKVTEQTLATKHKSMTNDMTVLAVPYSEVTNPEGGTTVNIAYIL